MKFRSISLVTACLLSLSAIVLFAPAAQASNWAQVNTSGFGDRNMFRCDAMVQFKSNLYCSAGGDSSHNSGIFRYDGSGPGGWSNVTPPGSGSFDSLTSDSNFLYAHSQGVAGKEGVYKYDGSSWTQIGAPPGINGVLAMYNGGLYYGSWIIDTGSQVWRYDGGTKWTQINTNGFGDVNNVDIYSMVQYGSVLCVGTLNVNTGTEIWQYDGTKWTQINPDGFGDASTRETQALIEYNGCLYAGTGNYTKGAQVWRYDVGTKWTQINQNGFGASLTVHSFAQFNGNLFVGTSDARVFKWDCWGWSQVNTDGFGSPNNIAALAMAIFNDRIFVSTYNFPEGTQVWEMADATVPTTRTWGTGSVGNTKPATDWYLAEGSTGGGMETWILVQNPNSTRAKVDITYMTGTGSVKGPSKYIDAGSRASFNVANSLPDNWGVSTVVSSDIPVVAERAMYGPGRTWGTDSIGTSSLADTWYLAEGTTAGGFETWVLVQNPNDRAANVNIAYMTDKGSVKGPSVRMKPGSRTTVKVSDTVPGDYNVSTMVSSDRPVIAERAVYWNGKKGATESVGVSTLQKTWYLAEGCTAGGMETWILVENPGSKPASVELNYMTGSGQIKGPHLSLPPKTRKTVKVNDTVNNDWDVSTVVSSDVPVAAERAVYWDNRIEGQDSIGTGQPATRWYLAEGSTGTNFETWVLVQNPGDSPAHVDISFMTRGGIIIGPKETLAPHTRKSYNVSKWCQENFQVSTEIRASKPVVVERSLYGNPN